jgi:hypothetical protein
MVDDDHNSTNLNDTPFTLLECDQHQKDISPCFKISSNKFLGEIQEDYMGCIQEKVNLKRTELHKKPSHNQLYVSKSPLI